MRTPILLTALPLIFAASLPALAQQPLQRADVPPPPELERLEEGEAPAVTIPGGGPAEKSITQKREQGRVTEVEVRTGRSTYVVKPLTPSGSALPGDTQANTNRAPQFKVKEFDLSKPEDIKPQPPAAPAPPAPAK
ncbi:MAG: hypothetical protein ABWY05_10940 [Noviherbaspirillum sp.]